MKNKILTFLFLFSFLPKIIFAEIISVREYKGYVRENPENDSPIIFEAKKNTPLKIISPYKGWILVENYEGLQGWIIESDISRHPSVIIKVDRAVVRDGPGENFESKWVVRKGMPFKFILRENNWYQIISSDSKKRGWVHAENIWGYGVTNDR